LEKPGFKKEKETVVLTLFPVNMSVLSYAEGQRLIPSGDAQTPKT